MFSDTEKRKWLPATIQAIMVFLSLSIIFAWRLARLAAMLEDVLYCYSSSWVTILTLTVHLAALLESVLPFTPIDDTKIFCIFFYYTWALISITKEVAM
jgi:hypothetical protein